MEKQDTSSQLPGMVARTLGISCSEAAGKGPAASEQEKDPFEDVLERWRAQEAKLEAFENVLCLEIKEEATIPPISEGDLEEVQGDGSPILRRAKALLSTCERRSKFLIAVDEPEEEDEPEPQDSLVNMARKRIRLMEESKSNALARRIEMEARREHADEDVVKQVALIEKQQRAMQRDLKLEQQKELEAIERKTRSSLMLIEEERTRERTQLGNAYLLDIEQDEIPYPTFDFDRRVDNSIIEVKKNHDDTRELEDTLEALKVKSPTGYDAFIVESPKEVTTLEVESAPTPSYGDIQSAASPSNRDLQCVLTPFDGDLQAFLGHCIKIVDTLGKKAVVSQYPARIQKVLENMHKVLVIHVNSGYDFGTKFFREVLARQGGTDKSNKLPNPQKRAARLVERVRKLSVDTIESQLPHKDEWRGLEKEGMKTGLQLALVHLVRNVERMENMVVMGKAELKDADIQTAAEEQEEPKDELISSAVNARDDNIEHEELLCSIVSPRGDNVDLKGEESQEGSIASPRDDNIDIKGEEFHESLDMKKLEVSFPDEDHEVVLGFSNRKAKEFQARVLLLVDDDNKVALRAGHEAAHTPKEEPEPTFTLEWNDLETSSEYHLSGSIEKTEAVPRYGVFEQIGDLQTVPLATLEAGFKEVAKDAVLEPKAICFQKFEDMVELEPKEAGFKEVTVEVPVLEPKVSDFQEKLEERVALEFKEVGFQEEMEMRSKEIGFEGYSAAFESKESYLPEEVEDSAAFESNEGYIQEEVEANAAFESNDGYFQEEMDRERMESSWQAETASSDEGLYLDDEFEDDDSYEQDTDEDKEMPTVKPSEVISKVTKIQALVRGHLCRVFCNQLKRQVLQERRLKHILRLQARWRGWRVRKILRLERTVQNTMATRIQSKWRGLTMRRKFRQAIALAKYIDEDDLDYSVVDRILFTVEEAADIQFDSSMISVDRPISTQGSSSETEVWQCKEEFTSNEAESMAIMCSGTEPIAARDLLDGVWAAPPVPSVNSSEPPPPPPPPPSEPKMCDRATTVIETEQKKKDQISSIARDWGFKNEKTVMQFLKACSKKRPSKDDGFSGSVPQDARKRRGFSKK